MPKYRYSIVLPARWESASIMEWLTYHRSIGFDHVYLYCNDDEPADMFDTVSPYLIGPEPFVTFMHYPFQGLQWETYLHWFRKFGEQTEWVALIDADEFLTLPGLDDVGRFVSRFPPECDGIYFFALCFGTNGFVERPTGSILRQYTRCADHITPSTKTLIRPNRINPDSLRPDQTPIWHFWDETQGQNLRCFSSLGSPMPELGDIERIGYGFAREIQNTAYISHYSIRSEIDFRRRALRGTGGTHSGQALWRDAMENGEGAVYIEMTNAAENLYLKSYWERLVGTPDASMLIPRPAAANLALQRPATQSSTCEWSKYEDHAHEAAGGVSGKITSAAGFCTAEEQSPWWQVDLGRLETVAEIRVFNRTDDMELAARCNKLILLASEDCLNWLEIYRRAENTPFGGADGNPLILQLHDLKPLRYLRVTIPNEAYLELAQIEVYSSSSRMGKFNIASAATQ